MRVVDEACSRCIRSLKMGAGPQVRLRQLRVGGWDGMGWVDTAQSEVKPIAERSYFEVQVQVDLEAVEGAALSGPVWPCLALSILPNPVLQWVFGLWVWPAWSDE